jgi:hypothetical protein
LRVGVLEGGVWAPGPHNAQGRSQPP